MSHLEVCTCRLFQIAYEGDFRSLCTVTFWQKTDLLISKPALVTRISTRDSTIVPNCASISKDVLAWSIFGNEPNNQSKLTGRVFIGCTARCPRMRLWPRLILLSWMVVSSTSLVRYGIVPLVWFSWFFPNFFLIKQMIYFCFTRKQYWTSSWK